MDGGRVVSTVAKIGFFLLVVAIGLVVFRKDSLRGLSDRWAMKKCPVNVEGDLKWVIPWANAKVDGCEGLPAHANCMVVTTEKSGRKTAPVKNWDCTLRHIPDDAATKLAGAALYFPGSEEAAAAGAQAQVERMQTAQREFFESIQDVTPRLRDRSDLLADR